jgi:hypothetical protein
MTNRILVAFGWLLLFSTTLFAQTTAFTYQGKLADNNANPLSGHYDFQFKLFDGTGTPQPPPPQQPTTVTLTNILVTAGIFTVQIDFGACATCFDGSARFLEIAVRPHSADPNNPPYATLSPRQPITSTPYAVKSMSAANATTADGLSVACVNCVTSSQIASVNGSVVTGAIPVGSVPPGSGNYIQNIPDTTAQQTADFNIGGVGTAGTLQANIVRAQLGYEIGGSRVLSTGNGNTFAGVFAGKDTVGCCNSLFGNAAGRFNIDGVQNSFFGYMAGYSNTGHLNTFIGAGAGENHAVGDSNSYFGTFAGTSDALGNYNTMIGYSANVAVNNLTHATAIGAEAAVSTSNTVLLGRSGGQDAVQIPGRVGIGIGTTAPITRLHIADNGGRILFGNGGCAAGSAGLGFASSLTCQNYSVLGDGTNTIINRPTGGAIAFRENNLDQMLILSGGVVSITTLGSAGSNHLCRNAFNEISVCSSSLRYKTNINPFGLGLSLVNRLSPIAFNWKQGGMKDLGLGAEDVEKVEPLLVTYNAKGEVEGVKYDRVAVVLINAVKEQQAQIDQQRSQIASLRTANATLNTRLRAIEKRLQKRGGSCRQRR